MNRRYRHIKLKEQLSIDKIYSFHYNELLKDFVYDGERHNFWEFLYVDKGEVEITTEFATFHLKQGDMVFYSPNEFHSLRCNRKTPPNIFIVSFDCKSEAMRFFTHKTVRLGDEERRLLSLLIEEGNKLFAMPVAIPSRLSGDRRPKHPLTRKEKPEFGAEQLIKMYLEMLFIRLIRLNRTAPAKVKLTPITKENEQRELVKRILDYLDAHLPENPSVDELCAEFALSRTQLRAVFREHTGCGVAEYVGRLRIERAKTYIREETSNVTEIAERLGFSSIHYFSRQFKKATGMSPSEYLKTMKARM
ncbi:AraC family transcriptional regulator [Paenibacillus flagellatus]|uniref:AraC family transcriptional regulator n=1 Tax=Paenibacillus flagellatus TaxID=2211139 RepID=A0A2V5K6E3_9BACL|nr:AraC family transcriptional regulator [Paenibacillus flagellatus]PYI54372.1 AraC family transcriptional regulator [Paenibacillus flagellatus]